MRNHSKRTKFIVTLEDEEKEILKKMLSPHLSITTMSLDELKERYNSLIDYKFNVQIHLTVASKLIKEIDEIMNNRSKDEKGKVYNSYINQINQRGKY